eukprot:403368062
MESQDKYEQDRKAKQQYLADYVLFKGYNPQEFAQYMLDKKENGGDVDAWTFPQIQYLVEEFTALAKPDPQRVQVQEQEQYQQQQQVQQNQPKQNIMDRMMYLMSGDAEQEFQRSSSQQDQAQQDFDNPDQQNQFQNRMSIAQVKQVFQDKVKVIKTQQLLPTPLTQIDEKKLSVQIEDGIVEQTKKLLKTTQSLSFRVKISGVNWDVRRNDQDFSILHKYLQLTMPHVLIPPLAQFKSTRKFDNKFIMKRGRLIEKFLRHCLRRYEIKANQAFVQFLNAQNRKDYESLVKAMDKEVACQSVEKLLTVNGQVQINESQYQHFVKESQKVGNQAKRFEGQDLVNIHQTIGNIHDSINQLSETYQELQPEPNESNINTQQTLHSLLALLSKAMNLWSQSYLNQKTVLNDNIINFFQYYSQFGEQIQDFYKKMNITLEDINSKEKSLNDQKSKLFTNKDVGTWKMKEQLSQEQIQHLQKNKSEAFQVMLPKETQEIQDKKDIFTVMVQSFKDEIQQYSHITYGDLKQQLEDMIEPVIKSYQNHVMIWQYKLKSSAASQIADVLQQDQVKLFPSTGNGKLISMEEFSLIDPNELEIFVVRPVKKIVSEYLIEVKIKNILRYKVQKRFRDFDSLDIALKQKFQNLKFPEIPSKTQILKKEQTRMKYYNDLFYHFKKYAIDYDNMRQRLLKVVYILLIMDSSPIKQCTHEKLEHANTLKDQNVNLGRYDSIMGKGDRSDSKKDNAPCFGGYSPNNTDPNEEENTQREEDFEVFLGYMEDNTLVADKGRFGATEITDRPSKAMIEQQRLKTDCNHLQDRRKTRRGSINQDEIEKVNNIDLLQQSMNIRELDLNPGLYHKMRSDMKQLQNRDIHIGYCWVKFPLSNQWQRLFARVQDSCIKFCKDVQVNEFLTSYVIYNCLIDTIKIKIPEWDNKAHLAMIIKHEFDAEWLLLAVEDEKQFYNKQYDLALLQWKPEEQKLQYKTNTNSVKILYYQLLIEDLKKHQTLKEQLTNTSENFFNMLGVQCQNGPQDKIPQPKIELQIRDLSQFTAMVMFNPNRDVVEDRPKKKEYSRKEINVMISKLVLTIYQILDIEDVEKLIFYFKYPNLSKFLRIAIILFLIYFDPQYLISYTLGIVIFIFILQNKSWHSHTQPLLTYIFFSKKNEYLNEEKGKRIITFRQDSKSKNMKTLEMASIGEKQDIDSKNKKIKIGKKKQLLHPNSQFEDEDAMLDDDQLDKDQKYERRQFGILEKYRDLKDKLSVLVFFFDATTDFVEKFNKLLIWQDQKSSKLFLIILIIIFLVISFLPLRYFIILAMLKKFNRGSSYYKRRYTGNKEATKIELRNYLLTTGNLKYEDLKRYGETFWMNKAWPTNKRAFEKNLINYLQDKLYILIPRDFVKQFKTPADLIECAGYIDQVLVLRPRDENEWELRNNKNLYRKSPNPLVYLYNFIMNNIASMIYLNKNKKYMRLDNNC